MNDREGISGPFGTKGLVGVVLAAGLFSGLAWSQEKLLYGKGFLTGASLMTHGPTQEKEGDEDGRRAFSGLLKSWESGLHVLLKPPLGEGKITFWHKGEPGVKYNIRFADASGQNCTPEPVRFEAPQKWAFVEVPTGEGTAHPCHGLSKISFVANNSPEKGARLWISEVRLHSGASAPSPPAPKQTSDVASTSPSKPLPLVATPKALPSGLSQAALDWEPTQGLVPPRWASTEMQAPKGVLAVGFGKRPFQRISPFVYGVNYHSPLPSWNPEWGKERLFTTVRLGGNAFSTWNWKNNFANAGTDGGSSRNSSWNACGIFTGSESTCQMKRPASAVAALLENQAKPQQVLPVLTLPLLGKVALGGSGYESLDMGGKGNWKLDDRVQKELVQLVHKNFPQDPLVWELDNEPDGWASTHETPRKDMGPATWEEVIGKSVAAARHLKSIDPRWKVMGPALMSYHGYRSLWDAPDANRQESFADAYLKAFKKASDAEGGKRLLDVFDFHYYPQDAKNKAMGRIRGPGCADTYSGAPATRPEALVNEPRTLWDESFAPTYDWETEKYGGAKRFLPRLAESIQRHAPGTRMAVTEWNPGASQGLLGALAAAQILGHFGREGVWMAHYWQLCDGDAGVQGAFRMYRNFDGKGGGFGDVSLPVSESVQGLEVFASSFENDWNHFVVVVVNTRKEALDTHVKLQFPGALDSTAHYRLSPQTFRPILGPDLKSLGKNGIEMSIAPQSLSILDIRLRK